MARDSSTPLFDRISSAEDSRAKTYRWLDDVLALLEAEAASGGPSGELLAFCVPAGFLSKTSLAFCHRTEEGILEPSSGRWGTWGMGGPTASLTLNGSASHSEGRVCLLSDILEATQDVPRKYYL